jgi:hypothetical protein
MFIEVAATGADDELTALLTEHNDDKEDEEEDEDEGDEDEDDERRDNEEENNNEEGENEEGRNVEGDHGLHKSNKAILRGARKKTVPKLSPTTWSSRVETLSALIAKYSSALEMLEKIADQSNGEPRSNAPSYIRLMESPEFIVALVVVQFILGFTADITKLLQANECNLGDAYVEVNGAKECIKDARADDSWSKVWGRVQTIGESIRVVITKPHVTANQRHCANAAKLTKQVKIITELTSTILSLVVEEIETRFAFEHKGLLVVQALVPIYLKTLTDANVKDLKKFFEKYLTFTQQKSLDTGGGNENFLMSRQRRSQKLCVMP